MGLEAGAAQRVAVDGEGLAVPRFRQLARAALQSDDFASAGGVAGGLRCWAEALAATLVAAASRRARAQERGRVFIPSTLARIAADLRSGAAAQWETL